MVLLYRKKGVDNCGDEYGLWVTIHWIGRNKIGFWPRFGYEQDWHDGPIHLFGIGLWCIAWTIG
jgi:hypothetical protein